METTIKRPTNEEKRKRQHEIIQQWKKDVAETKEQFQAWLKTPEAEQMRRELEQDSKNHNTVTGD